MSLTLGADQGAIAWGNWLSEFAGKPALYALVTSLQLPNTFLSSALGQLLNGRGLDTASGVQLDGIGSIVGQPRTITNALYLAFFGYVGQTAGRAYGVARYRRENESFATSVELDDAGYRLLIRLKIILNNAHATEPDILSAARLMFGTDLIVVSTTGPGQVTVSVGIPLDQSDTLLDEAKGFIPRAAGVAVTFTTFSGPMPTTSAGT